MVQLLAAFLGSLGFALIFKIRGYQIWFAAVGGALTWGVYLFSYSYIEDYFICYFIAAVFVAIYSEFMARFNRAPSTIFLTATAVPLIPGGSLYYTMFGLVSDNKSMFVENGINTVTIALAIALGFVAIAVINKYIVRLMQNIKNKKEI